ncbi:hypothetical protein [Methylobacterium durans]|uniref:Uncharacterized protein n=1 Tax=Methylobacterium durans TaxID=2202825 RepID=A0A2U8WAI7_9HYPH|nr:hypothetical protein [Methylobacterium durans]AWN43165.1 hypothetical protein DK389_25055 [Methylobacterium durans]
MANIGVKPVRKGMALTHPLDGPLADDGGLWRDDQFTLRRLRDGDIKRVETDEADAHPARSAAPAASKGKE